MTGTLLVITVNNASVNSLRLQTPSKRHASPENGLLKVTIKSDVWSPMSALLSNMTENEPVIGSGVPGSEKPLAVNV